jgi:hypothetical protein
MLVEALADPPKKFLSCCIFSKKKFPSFSYFAAFKKVRNGATTFSITTLNVNGLIVTLYINGTQRKTSSIAILI